MFKGNHVTVIVPCYNEASQITRVIETMPEYVDEIQVIDDASSDGTSSIVEAIKSVNTKVRLVKHASNRGVGAAIESGYRAFLETSSDVAVVMAGDGQMDPTDLPAILDPVVAGSADYSKANRLTYEFSWKSIPRVRLFGNMILSFLTRLATGYWSIGDSQTGYTAANRRVVAAFVARGVYPRYGVPNDLLITCALVGARVTDVPTAPVYDVGENSKLVPRKVALPILRILIRGFFKRLFVRLLLVDGNPVPIAFLAGIVCFLTGAIWSSLLILESIRGTTDPGVVSAVSILFVGGVVLLTLAVVLDVVMGILKQQSNQPEPKPQSSAGS